MDKKVKAEASVSSQEVISSIIAYSLCSGTLVLLNKITLYHLPYPSLVVSFQLLATVIFIYSCKVTRILQVDDIEWRYVKPYLYYIVAFSVGVYCNMKSLSISNVETVIVFRAASPCVVAILDVLFLGREYPTSKSWLSLGTIIIGAIGYATTDTKFQIQGYFAYFWPLLYLIVISFEMAIGKQLLRSVDLKTLSGPVLYTNILGVWPFLVFAYMGGEYSTFYNDIIIGEKPLTTTAIVFLVISSAVGTGIGYSGWWCRDKVAATSFTLIGVINKCLTVLLNLIIWDQHAGAAGIASLVLCLVGGVFYQQAPLRTINTNAIAANSKAMTTDDDDSTSSLLVSAFDDTTENENDHQHNDDGDNNNDNKETEQLFERKRNIV